MPNENTTKRELVRFRVNEVSVVDRPAIESPFALIKSADGGAADPTTAKAEGDMEGAPAAGGGTPAPAADGAKAPVHAALLMEKVDAFKQHATELLAMVGNLNASDPEALREQLEALSEANWRTSEMVYAITNFVRSVPGAVLAKAAGGSPLAGTMVGFNRSLDAVQKAAAGETPMNKPTTPAATAPAADPKKPEAANKPAAKAEGDAEGTPCPTCEGTGKVDGAPCPDCEGTGVMKAEAAGTAGATGRTTAKRFTAERLGKLSEAFATLGSVLKEAGAKNLEELMGMAAAEPALAKALATGKVESDADLRQQVQDLQKRLDMRENAGIPRDLGGDGQPVSKAAESVFKGIV